MCFSAPASFIAGAVLATVGVVTLRMATRPAQIAFAAIPLLFGIQQLFEGLILLSGHRIIRVFGILSLATFLAAYAIHVATVVSVWCFFAAILSCIIYAYFRRERFPA